jgi:hypothetical protein
MNRTIPSNIQSAANINVLFLETPVAIPKGEGAGGREKEVAKKYC